MNYRKFTRIFFLVLIIIGIGLLVTQKMWVPKVVEIILKNDNNHQEVSTSLDNKNELTNFNIYTDIQNRFEIKYPQNLSLAPMAYKNDFDNNTSKDKFILFNPTIEPSYIHSSAGGEKSAYNDGFAFGIYPNSEKTTFLNKIKNDDHNFENDVNFQIGQQIGVHYYQGTLIGPSYVTYFPTKNFFFLIYYGNENGDYSQKILESILATLKFLK